MLGQCRLRMMTTLSESEGLALRWDQCPYKKGGREPVCLGELQEGTKVQQVGGRPQSRKSPHRSLTVLVARGASTLQAVGK